MKCTADIRLTDVIVTYRRVPAVHHVTGKFQAGTLTALAGPNGAGKSTLLKALMGLVPVSDGTIDRGGLSARAFAYLPQLPEIDRSFPLSVEQTVLFGAWPRTGALSKLSSAERSRAKDAIASVGLTGYAGAAIASLSIGQWHRVMFARLIMQDAAVILLDEPFAAVDERTTDDLMALVKVWHAEGRTVIAVLHDLNFIRRHFPETLLIAREVVAWGATAAALEASRLDQARTMTDRWARNSDQGSHGHQHNHDHSHPH
ncbi:MAG: metal ABC transporter ATP-binding protein [Micropepsaceae bacterium]